MRYDKRVKLVHRFNEQNVMMDDTFIANITPLGVKTQNAVFGDVKQGRIVARFQGRLKVRTGFMMVGDDVYQIENSMLTDKKTTLYGVEYHGRLRL